MNLYLYTFPGCLRCHVAASFLDKENLAYHKLDIQGQGKEAFQKMYRQHRTSIHRGSEGIEFPILVTGKRVIQGVGPICAWLQAGDRLKDFIDQSPLRRICKKS